jgi:hypothetical protein
MEGVSEASAARSTAENAPAPNVSANIDVEAGTLPDVVESEKNPDVHKKRRKKSASKRNGPYRPWDQYPMGYPRFAAFISEDKDKSSTIYRRFERLAARNLLYLESELAELEAKQDEMDEAYQTESPEFKMTARSWKALRREAPETFFELEGGNGLQEVLDTQQVDSEDDQASDNDLASAGRRGFGVKTKSKPVRDLGLGKDIFGSRQRLLLAYRIRSVLREYCKLSLSIFSGSPLRDTKQMSS